MSQADPHRGNLVAVEHNFGLGLIDLHVTVRGESELAALHGRQLEPVGETRDLLMISCRGDHELDGHEARAGQGRGQEHRGTHASDVGQLEVGLIGDGEDLPVALIPGLDQHAAKALEGECDLEGVLELRGLHENASHLGAEGVELL